VDEQQSTGNLHTSKTQLVEATDRTRIAQLTTHSPTVTVIVYCFRMPNAYLKAYVTRFWGARVWQ